MHETTTITPWENELASLLSDLSGVQEEMLDVLNQKREHMAAGNLEAINELSPLEDDLGQRLEACRQRRRELLDRAVGEGLPGDSIATLAKALPASGREKMGKRVKEASARMRLLQHASLTNWVLAQQTLLHLSQLIEIIATGGRLLPTYGNNEAATVQGALVDEAA